MAGVTTLRTPLEGPVDTEPQRAYTLPSRYYLSEEIFEAEKEAIFYRNWHYIGHASQLENPGDYLTLRIADENVFVIRGEDDMLRGFYNVCRHRAHELLEGAGSVKSIVCPYHAWTYATDGSLRYARMSEKLEGFNREEFCLPQIRVEQVHGFVFVNLDDDAPSLQSVAGAYFDDIAALIPQFDELRPVEKLAFGPDSGMAANWKVVVDNYLECYHCQKAHPQFGELLDLSAYETAVHDVWARQLGPECRIDNSAYTIGNEDPVRSGGFWYLWPTTTVNFLPGQVNMQVLSILPVGVGKATFAGDRYALPDERDDTERMTYFNEVLALEDKLLCESVQRGLKSRSYDQGRFVHDAEITGPSEQGVNLFHRLVYRALQAG